jgi:hypothetical protein
MVTPYGPSTSESSTPFNAQVSREQAQGALRPMSVCQTAIEEIERARLDRLRGIPSDALDGHSLLCQLKVAAFLALLEEHQHEISEEDWRLAGIVREVSDRTRQYVVDVLRRRSVQDDRARAYAEAERAIVVTDRRTERTTQLAGKAIMRKLETVGDWVTRSELRRSLASKDRGYFEDALEALIAAGQVEERRVQSKQSGTEYRKRQ